MPVHVILNASKPNPIRVLAQNIRSVTTRAVNSIFFPFAGSVVSLFVLMVLASHSRTKFVSPQMTLLIMFGSALVAFALIFLELFIELFLHERDMPDEYMQRYFTLPCAIAAGFALGAMTPLAYIIPPVWTMIPAALFFCVSCAYARSLLRYEYLCEEYNITPLKLGLLVFYTAVACQVAITLFMA